MMKTTWTSLVVVALAVTMVFPVVALDKEQAAAARKVFAANKDAVVFLTGVTQVELSAGGQTFEREGEFQAIGTVIDPSGLVVTSLSLIGASGEQGTGAQRVVIKVKRHEQVKIVLADGTEVPADVVLKDPDLDLAFLAPRKDSPEYKDATWTVVQFDPAAKVQEFDIGINISRLAKSFNLEAVSASGEISGVVTKPRKFYFGPTRPGVPIFNLDGKVIGLTILYKPPGDESSRAVVVLPAEDILKIAQQAKDAKPVEEEEPSAKATTDEE